MRAIYIAQAECRVITGNPDAALTTVLGSCIACCMWDPRAGVGGMNHFLLPGTGAASSNLAAMSAGSTAMEVLINQCLKAGASRGDLLARLFGGAAVVPRLSDIGARNAEFASRFLRTEGIPLVSASLGGNRARRVMFWPMTGRAEQRLVEDTPREVVPAPAPEVGAVELF